MKGSYISVSQALQDHILSKMLTYLQIVAPSSKVQLNVAKFDIPVKCGICTNEEDFCICMEFLRMVAKLTRRQGRVSRPSFRILEWRNSAVWNEKRKRVENPGISLSLCSTPPCWRQCTSWIPSRTPYWRITRNCRRKSPKKASANSGSEFGMMWYADILESYSRIKMRARLLYGHDLQIIFTRLNWANPLSFLHVNSIVVNISKFNVAIPLT